MIHLKGFEIENRLYKGTKSTIYKGKRKENNESVIIKVNTNENPLEEEIIRYKNEFKIAGRIRGKYCIGYYDLFSFENRLVLIKEYFDGVALSEIVSTKEQDIISILEVALRIVKGLKEIHDCNVIHKDINPNNILINLITKEIKIIDFGIATELKREHYSAVNPETIQGTLAYISPEQTGRMNRSVDYRTDFYSLGVTLYEMAARRLPFKTDDSMELIHAHIAREPESVSAVNPVIPQVFSNIIMKLLAKNAEDRYQSAMGIIKDLEKCLEQLKDFGIISDFRVGDFDFSDQICIPEKLYGRDEQKQVLFKEFDKMIKGNAGMICFSGLPGIGKSFLINEIHKPLVREKGYFISGKYNLFERNIPYNAIIRAFRDLMRQILTEDDVRITKWKERILQAVGKNGSIITEILPEVELLIGKQPEAPGLPPTENRNRFNFVLISFMKVFTRRSHPLILFLDDLQWIDFASLYLLKLILIDPAINSFFFIGAYRDNEVSEFHPLVNLFEELTLRDRMGENVTLPPLLDVHVNRMIADTLLVSPEKTVQLTDLIYKKTGGNPFFVKEFLVSLFNEKLLYFTNQNGKKSWEYDLAKIEQAVISDNVASFLVNRMEKLSSAKLFILKIASCFGTAFSLHDLAVLNNKNDDETFEQLKEAVNKGFVVKQEDNYRFVHDKVQEAAYSLLTPREKTQVHYRIGSWLLEKTGPGNYDDVIFEVTRHLNRATTYPDFDKNINIVELNLKAGIKARNSTAFTAAKGFFLEALKVLPPDSWKSHYEQTLQLYDHISEACILTGDDDPAEEYLDVLFKNARSELDKVKAYELKIVDVLTSNPKQAVQLAIKSLKSLGIYVPARIFYMPAVLKELLITRFLLIGKNIDSLTELPVLTDARKTAAIRMGLHCGTTFYIAEPVIIPIVILQGLNIQLKWGNSTHAAFIYVSYGLILTGYLGDVENGLKFGKLALKVLEKKNVPEIKAKVYFIFATMIYHWKANLSELTHYYLEGYRAGKEVGDFEYAAYHLVKHIWSSKFYRGIPLEKMRRHIAKHYDDMRGLHIRNILAEYEFYCQVITVLTEVSDNPLSLNGHFFDEEKTVAMWTEVNDLTHLAYYYITKQFLYYLFNEYDLALEMAEKAKPYLRSIMGMRECIEFNFIYSLTLLAICREKPVSKRAKLLLQVRKNQKKMKKWKEYCPSNLEHKYLLVQAELTGFSRNFDSTIEVYERAISYAKDEGYLQDEAIALERTARYCLANGFPRFAKVYVKKAYGMYTRWGAVNKKAGLKNEFAGFLKSVVEMEKLREIDIQAGKSSSAHSTTTSGLLDVSAIMKASNTIAGEIEMESLLSKMIKILIENAGAGKAVLLLKEYDNSYLIQAEAEVASNTISTLEAIPLDMSNKLSPAIIRYVAKTREPLVLDDAGEDGLFVKDEYIRENHIKSVLCLPIINKKRLEAILYLENNLMTCAFSPNRVETLKMLSTQAAISIENARLIQNLGRQERLEKEMEIAKTIQTSLAPQPPLHGELDITGGTRPAIEVGGDYYDILFDTNKNLWLAIGDVSGHGVTPGLIMMMAKAFFSASIKTHDDISPKEAIVQVNNLLHENIRNRLKETHFMTMTFLKYLGAGQFVHAGAHLDIMVYRAAKKHCELIETNGTFLGFIPDVTRVTVNETFSLDVGDILLLYTDGITEARNHHNRKLMGETRLQEILVKNADKKLEELKESIVEETLNWCGHKIRDDITFILAKRKA